jgi:hypothetical protein
VSRPPRQKLTALLLFLVLTVGMTWPQARYLSTHVHDSDDPLLSIWRLAWIAHILPQQPSQLLNGNIFHPEPRTLAYSDAVLLQGVVAAPMIWAGLSPVAVYNAMVLGSIALSGWAMWLYAVRLTGSSAAGVIAGIVFAFVPFRFDHFNHLELHATFFLPLTLLALERLIETQSRRDAAWLMAAMAGQVYSGIYYAVFLATALMLIVPFRLALLDAGARDRLARALTPAMLAAAIAVTPYLMVYVSNRVTLGERQAHDIAMYSAAPRDYLAATPHNLVHGGRSANLGANERRLFPGAIAVVLAIIGAAAIDRRRATLLICAAVGLILSLGFNTPLYEWIRAVLVPYRGLRAPARASVLVFLALAALAAYGYTRLTRGRSRRFAAIAATIVCAAMLLEYLTPLRGWLVLPPEPPQVYRWLASQPRLVVAEVPFAQAARLDRIHDGVYMFNSTYHWQPMVNGYSGYFPGSFITLAEAMEHFPADRAIAVLKERGVDVIIVHGALLGAARYGEVTAALLRHPDLEATAQFDEPGGSDMVFRVRR